MPPTKHHEMAPSSAPAIMQCACYEAGYSDDNPFSDDSIGTALHAVCEALMNDKEPPDYEILTDEHTEKCGKGVEEVRAFCEARYPGTKILTELPVTIRDVYGNIISEGTQDVDCPPDVGGDWKAGLDYKPQNHDYKPQQAFYALGRMQERKIDKIQWFEYYIMPERLIPYELTKEECIAIIRVVYQRKYSKKKSPQCCYHCRHCKNILYCYAVNRQIKMVSDCYKDLPLPDNIHNPGEIIDGREMSKMLVFAKDILTQYIKRIKAIVKKIEDSALALSDEGVPIPYFQKVGKTKNTIDDFDTAYSLVPGVTKEQFYSAMSLSIPQLADAYYRNEKAKDKKVTKKLARNRLEAKLMPVLSAGDITYSLERKLTP